MQYVQSNGMTLAYDEFGAASDPAILLISGLGAQMIRWMDPFCLMLAEQGYRVIRYDNRDSGCSTHMSGSPTPDMGAFMAALMRGQTPETAYTLDDLALDAIGLLDALSIEKAHAVGRSMGGMIAQIMAYTFPGRIASLTSIMSTTGNPALPPPAPDAMALMAGPAPDPLSAPAAYLDHRVALSRHLAGRGFPFDADLARRLILDELSRSSDRDGFLRQFAAVAIAGDRRERLSTVRSPTLVIHGADDPLFPGPCGEDTAASVPGAELRMIQGMGHDIPPQLYGLIAEAIDRTARRAPISHSARP